MSLLSALVDYYEDLITLGKISRPGWALSKISIALEIDSDGNLIGASSAKTEQQRGKKFMELPTPMELPAPVQRAKNIKSNFLWDNPKFILGFDEDPEFALPRFLACSKLHDQLLSSCSSPAAKAVRLFFHTWNPDDVNGMICVESEDGDNVMVPKLKLHPVLGPFYDDLKKGVNLTFVFDGKFVQDNPDIRKAWDTYYAEANDLLEYGTCMVTGEKNVPLAKIHPLIKGVRGAQSTGAALVSYNAPSSCFFGKKQGQNAPISQYAAFAYTSALNYLFWDPSKVSRLGNLSIVCWAEGGEEIYPTVFRDVLRSSQQDRYGDSEPSVSLNQLLSYMLDEKCVRYGDVEISPGQKFYVLGISPAMARLSIRFFFESSFGDYLENIQAHYDRLDIIRPAYDNVVDLTPWRLCLETTRLKDDPPQVGLLEDLITAILNDSPYPAALLNGVHRRIQAENNVSRGKAAIIKAYYLKKPHPDVPKEVLTVSLNESSTNVPYILGRLFSVLEEIQNAANPQVICTIKDRYFQAAARTPARIYFILINQSDQHLRKIKRTAPSRSGYLQKKRNELLEQIECFPEILNFSQRDAFLLGYYHQNQKRYEKKSEKSGGEENEQS